MQYVCRPFLSFTHTRQHPNLNVRVKVTKRIQMIVQNFIAVLQLNREDCKVLFLIIYHILKNQLN